MEPTMNLVERIDASADRWMDELIALRRTIHEHPELAFEEHETAKRVQEFLTQARAFPAARASAGPGVVAMLEGAKPGPTVAIRADMDALPMSEPDGLPFASKVPGKMHSCGHDAHTAIALGVAAVLAEQREHLARPRDVHLPARRGDARPARARCWTRARSTRSPTPSSAFTTGRRSPPAPSAGIRRR